MPPLRLKGFLLPALLFPVALAPAIDQTGATPATTIRILPEEIVDTPTSPKLYSHFIELGYGVQTEPMWAEMLWNRSLEPFTPYGSISLTWFDLYHDRNDHSKGYETDWRVFDWYHSGYQHDAWFAAPAPLPGFLPFDDQSTFFIPENPEGTVRLEAIDGGAAHGQRYVRIVNNSAMPGGLAQEGKYLRAGTTLEFGGWFRSDAVGLGSAVVSLFRPDEWDNPIASAEITGIGPVMERFSATIEVGDYTGWAVFAIFIPADSAVAIDALTLMPTDHVGGWRPDVVAEAKRIKPSVIRFPGGCFASFYDWREGIGPRDKRVPRPSYFWGGQNDNEVGIAEMARLARELDAEIMYCVNVFHPLKQLWDYHLSEEIRGKHSYDLPQFANIEQGAREAAALVAYSNAPVTHPLGALRASHGHPEPFNIRYWELDNETHRWMHGMEYAEAAALYAKAMKEVDPSILIGVISYTDEYVDSLPGILERGVGLFDFIADRAYGQGQLDHKLAIIREHNARHDDHIFYTNTEWLAYEFEPDAYNRLDLDSNADSLSYMFSKWRYALNIARNYLMFERAGGIFRFTNFNNFANTHSQSVIETPREGVFLTASGRIFELMADTGASWPLALDGHRFDVASEFVVNASWTLDRDSLVVQVVNMSDESRRIDLQLASLGRSFQSARFKGLVADGPLEMNTLDRPDGIRDFEASPAITAQGAVDLTIAPWSVSILTLE